MQSPTSLIPTFDKPNASHETLFKWLYDAVADECSGNMQHAWKHLNKDTLEEVFNYRSIVKGYSILHRAIESKQNQNVRFLLQNGFPVKDTFSVDGLTPLLLAIQTRNIDIARELLTQNLDSTDDIGNTPLHYAIQYNMEKSFVKEIIDLKKELLEMPNLSGLYPIHFACIYNRLDLIDFFKDTFRVVDRFWNSPLMYASKMGHLEMVEKLVTESELSLKNSNGETALDLVGKEASLAIPIDLEKIKQLISNNTGKPEEQHRLELEHLHRVREIYQQRCDKIHNHKVNRLERDLSKLYDLMNLIREKQRDLETRYESLMQLLKK
jgi:ankyrin repeat protein